MPTDKWFGSARASRDAKAGKTNAKPQTASYSIIQMTEDHTNTSVPTEGKKRGVRNWLQALIWVAMLGATVYAVQNRSADDYLRYGTYIGLGFSVAFLLLFAIIIASRGLRKISLKTIGGLFTIIVLLPVVAGIMYYSAAASLYDIYLWILSPSLSRTSEIIFTVIFVLAAGLGLFYFRLRARAIYGIFEIATGIFIVIYLVTSQKELLLNSDLYLAILSASVFLIVRGCDNIHQGICRQPVDGYGTRFFKFLMKRG